MWLQMPSVGLAELCKIMMEQGYTHASFVSDDALSAFYKNEIKLNVCRKPEGIYFTLLDKDEYVPEWYQFCMNWPNGSVKYSSCSVMFIKATPEDCDASSIIPDSDGRLKSGGFFKERDGKTDWIKVRQGDYKGVRIDSPHDEAVWDSLYVWDVDTIVIWDPVCELIHGSRVFRGLGNYHYEDDGIQMLILLNKVLEKLLKM